MIRARLRTIVAAALPALLPVLLTTSCNDAASTPPAQEEEDEPEGRVYESDLLDFRVVTVVEGLEHPWGMAFLPNGDILVTERPGRLRLVRDGALVDEPVAGVPDARAGGQGGLLDIALHPDFEANRWIYFTYSKPGSDGRTTAIARGRWEGDRLAEVEDLYVAEAWGSDEVHFGSRIAFDGQGFLYVTVGERGERNEAQDLSNDQGAVLRLNDDGTIPADNPFAGEDGNSGAVWAFGIRNAQGLAFHRATGELWEAEHGPQGGDEINVIERGSNYGWPEITYGVDYDGSVISPYTAMDGMKQPVHHWETSPALSGLTVYTGAAFEPWQGHLFAGGLAGQQLIRLEFREHDLVDSETLLGSLGHRIRDVRTGPDGMLYLLVDAEDAPMLRLEPVDGG